MADVFVSYHKKDRAHAEAAVASLHEQGYSVWWDDRVTPMENWDRTVEREIRDALCVLVLWTADSVESEWVRIEANYAKLARPAKLVQVRLEPCDIPINFSLIQFADAFPGPLDPKANRGWAKAMEWVGLFVPKPQPVEVAAAPSAPAPAEARAMNGEPAAELQALPSTPQQQAGRSSKSASTAPIPYALAIPLLGLAALLGPLLWAMGMDLGWNYWPIDVFPSAPLYNEDLQMRAWSGVALGFVLAREAKLERSHAFLAGLAFSLAGFVLPGLPIPGTYACIGLTMFIVAMMWWGARKLGALEGRKIALPSAITALAIAASVANAILSVEGGGGRWLLPFNKEALWALAAPAPALFLESMLALVLLAPLRAGAQRPRVERGLSGRWAGLSAALSSGKDRYYMYGALLALGAAFMTTLLWALLADGFSTNAITTNNQVIITRSLFWRPLHTEHVLMRLAVIAAVVLTLRLSGRVDRRTGLGVVAWYVGAALIGVAISSFMPFEFWLWCGPVVIAVLSLVALSRATPQNRTTRMSRGYAAPAILALAAIGLAALGGILEWQSWFENEFLDAPWTMKGLMIVAPALFVDALFALTLFEPARVAHKPEH